jgi:hypothetical protein
MTKNILVRVFYYIRMFLIVLLITCAIKFLGTTGCHPKHNNNTHENFYQVYLIHLIPLTKLQLHATNYNYKLQLEFNVLSFWPYLSQIYMESPKCWTKCQGITMPIHWCDDYKVWVVVTDIHIGMTNFTTKDQSKLIYKLV